MLVRGGIRAALIRIGPTYWPPWGGNNCWVPDPDPWVATSVIVRVVVAEMPVGIHIRGVEGLVLTDTLLYLVGAWEAELIPE